MALSAGMTHIDAAQVYGNEDSVGKGLAKHLALAPRDSVFVTTKLYKLEEGETVRDALKTSLKKLQLDHVDL